MEAALPRKRICEIAAAYLREQGLPGLAATDFEAMAEIARRAGSKASRLNLFNLLRRVRGELVPWRYRVWPRRRTWRMVLYLPECIPNARR